MTESDFGLRAQKAQLQKKTPSMLDIGLEGFDEDDDFRDEDDFTDEESDVSAP